MDGTMSGACRDSKQVEMDPLAIEREGQREQRKDMKKNAPRPPRPPPIYPRSLTNYFDPLCR